MNMKKCSCCQRELPAEMFWKNKHSKDGLQNMCINCMNEKYFKKRNIHHCNAKEEDRGGILQANKIPELAKFTPRELIAELRSRGYTGELTYTYKIKV